MWKPEVEPKAETYNQAMSMARLILNDASTFSSLIMTNILPALCTSAAEMKAIIILCINHTN